MNDCTWQKKEINLDYGCFSKINVELIFYFNDLLTFLLTLYQPDIYESVARIYRKNTVNK